MELPFLLVEVGLTAVVEASVVISPVLDLAMLPTQSLVLHHQLSQFRQLVCRQRWRGEGVEREGGDAGGGEEVESKELIQE